MFTLSWLWLCTEDIAERWRRIKEELLRLLRVKKEAEALEDLQRDVQTRRSYVYLNLGWNGGYKLCVRFHADWIDVEDLWQDFYKWLLQMHQSLSSFWSIENILLFLGKTFRPLLLCFALSEFPNRRRPPCTTMPWTIWPALVVLWGVCWMFYEGSDWDWTYQEGSPAGSNTAYPHEDLGYIDLFQGYSAPSLLLNQG